MTPEQLATLHAQAMQVPAPWSTRDFEELLGGAGVFLISQAHGFALGRIVLDEAELLTLAVAPQYQRGGNGSQLLAGFERRAQKSGATSVFLEVAATNSPAQSLYAAAGWATTGVRKGYYRAKPLAIDALLMSKALPIT